jgi:nucleotide-binding universal stress UspA family protein
MEPFAPGILHPTDFSEASRVAFAHALAIAIARKAKLTVLNVESDMPTVEDWQRFPSVRGTLEAWGLLEKGSERADVFDKLQVKIKKVAVDDADPVDAISDYLAEHPNDLLVVATEQRDGLPRFMHGSVGHRAARHSGIDALFVPEGSAGFVCPDDGTLSLERILVPIDHTPDPTAALEAASRAAYWLGTHPVEIHLMHVGTEMPSVALPFPEKTQEWTVARSLRQGDPVEQILAAAKELPAQLVLMATDGRDNFLDVFRGSHAERVVRGASCPVGAITSV